MFALRFAPHCLSALLRRLLAAEARPEPPDFAALDRAYQAGVFNKDEYEAKKAGLESQAAALDALDKARAAGVVTGEDFARIKSRLIAKGASLASLDGARKAGVFTQDEYDARKRAVMNDGTEVPFVPEAALRQQRQRRR